MGDLVYGWVLFFLEIGICMGGKSNFPAARPYQNQTWVPPRANDIESIQKRACRIILGNSYESYKKALESCQLHSLSERREDHCYKFAVGLSDNERTKSLLPPSRFECHGRSLRNQNNISKIACRTNRSFFYKFIK